MTRSKIHLHVTTKKDTKGSYVLYSASCYAGQGLDMLEGIGSTIDTACADLEDKIAAYIATTEPKG